jgi:uncharacterized membrane protein YraQ (UPF0718 family)
MLAAPIVNPITALSTWKAFQGQNPAMMTSSRILLGFLIAVGVGLVVSRLPLVMVIKEGLLRSINEQDFKPRRKVREKSAASDDVGSAPDLANIRDNRLVAAFRSALKDFVEVGVYFTIGVAITALFNTGIAPGATWLDGLAGNTVAAPAALMALAFILSLCSTSDAFIAATLDKFAWGAKLAFLTFGPMMDVKLIFLYQTVLRKKFIIALALGLFLVIGGITIFWQQLIFQAR